MKLIAISGGIGSGKSVAARVLRVLGFEVYDTDVRAKQLMDGSADLKRTIADEICREAILADGRIDRVALAAAVFASDTALARLNELVHGLVLDDLSSCAAQTAANGGAVLFVETALLYESGLDKMVDEVWEVTAPEELRVRRVLRRNPGMTEAQIRARIDAQSRTVPVSPHPCVCRIVNDDLTPVLPQLLALVERER